MQKCCGPYGDAISSRLIQIKQYEVLAMHMQRAAASCHQYAGPTPGHAALTISRSRRRIEYKLHEIIA